MTLTDFKPRSKRTTAVLACGGSSTRMGENKLLIDICGKTCIRHSAEAVSSCPDVIKLVVAAPRELWGAYRDELLGIALPIEFAESGATRAESIKNAADLSVGDIILIHDGARPLVTPREVQSSVDDAFKHLSSVICTPVKDTIRYSDGGKSFSPERSCLYTVRTPQTFSLSLYRYALENVKGDYTDDAQLLDALGITPHITLGEYTNIKLTTRDDVTAAMSMVSDSKVSEDKMRIGQGYDVHRLVSGRKLILGGVDIPHEMGLLGHSDADVLVHAIMDAVLGAAAMGDIGKLFPDSGPAYSGADSLRLLAEVMQRVREKGFEVENIDSTVIAQAPKLAPYIIEMRKKIAEAAGVRLEQVSVKATTEEGLGFSGSKQGIAAHAVALLR